MNKTPRRSGRVRLQPYVEPTTASSLEVFCGAAGVTESAVVEAALHQYHDKTGDTTLLLRRLDRLGRALERAQRDLELLSEAFAVWVKLWFAHTPTIPDEGKPAARMTAENRYRLFVEHLAQQFSGGSRFLDDLPRETLADSAELAHVAAEPITSPPKP